MSFHRPSESDQPILIHNCTFDEDTEVNDDSTASKLESDRQAFLSFEETTVEFYSCDFIGLKNEAQLVYGSDSNITMMNIDIQGIEGTFMNTTGCNAQIKHSHFSYNNGTVLILYREKLRIEDSILTGNQGEYAGGIALYENCQAHVINSTLVGNEGEQHAGGIYLKGSKAHVINSTLTGNQGKHAGGIDVAESKAKVINSTLIGNKGEAAGGINVYKGNADVIDSTLTGNKGDQLEEFMCMIVRLM